MSKCHEYQPNKATKTGGNDMSTSNSHKSRRYIDCCSQTKDQRNAVDCILPIQQNVQSWARFSMRWLKKCLVSLQSTPLCICAFHRISLALFCMCLCVSFVSFAFYVYDPHAFRPCLYQSMQAAFVHVCCVFVWPTVWIRFSPSMWLHWLQQQLHGQLNDSYNCAIYTTQNMIPIGSAAEGRKEIDCCAGSWWFCLGIPTSNTEARNVEIKNIISYIYWKRGEFD